MAASASRAAAARATGAPQRGVMPCFHPLWGYKSKHENPTGKRSIVFKLANGLIETMLPVPCGKCSGCKLERSRQWALRCLHEAQLHQDNCFITLTYDDQHLPPGGTLKKTEPQKFMKRLRRWCRKKISVFYCGEYGDETRRPHYHALLFGLSFSDQVPFKRSSDGSMLYTSATLSRLWPYGHSSVGALTFESAAYVARYAMKKLSFFGDEAYEHIDLETGEVIPLEPEFIRMSLKPAIAKEWFAQFHGDAYPSDFLVSRGRKMKPPKYYDKLLELRDAKMLEEVKLQRRGDAVAKEHDSTPARRAAREECLEAKISQLKRSLQ